MDEAVGQKYPAEQGFAVAEVLAAARQYPVGQGLPAML
jgi:hypothetical protein